MADRSVTFETPASREGAAPVVAGDDVLGLGSDLLPPLVEDTSFAGMFYPSQGNGLIAAI